MIGNTAANEVYEGWLYAAVSTPTGGFDGLFMTKDFGQNWTKVGLNTLAPFSANQQAVATNDITKPAYPITFGTQGNQNLALVVDPTNPNIVYLGSFGGDNYLSDTGLIRVDVTNMWDAHSLVAFDNFAADGGQLTRATTGPAPVNTIQGLPYWYEPVDNGLLGYTFNETSFLNFIRNPYAPFVSNATLLVVNYNSFTNNGAGATWTPYDLPGKGGIPGTGYHVALAENRPNDRIAATHFRQ